MRAHSLSTAPSTRSRQLRGQKRQAAAPESKGSLGFEVSKRMGEGEVKQGEELSWLTKLDIDKLAVSKPLEVRLVPSASDDSAPQAFTCPYTAHTSRQEKERDNTRRRVTKQILDSFT